MKILHIGKYFPPYAGGMEHYLRDLMTAQARQGLEPSALVHQSDPGLTSREEHYPTGDHSLTITRVAVWMRVLFTPVSPAFPWHLQRLIRRQRPDVLHLHMPNVSAFWALLLPGARKIPWLVHWHADVLASQYSLGLRLFYSLYRPFERAILKRAKAIIATSPPYLASSRPLREFAGKCHVVPLGLAPPAPLAAETDTLPPPGGHPLKVLGIGRLTYYKGFEHLIRAAARCQGVAVHLVGHGDQEAKLRALARDLKAEQRVTFHGHLDDVQLLRQLRNCDCLCLPSIERTEAFGLVLLEAMWQSKPCIVSDVPGSGMAWVIDSGENGLTVPPGNEGELAAALQQLQSQPQERDRMGANGRRKFEQYFHIERSAAAVSAIYGQLRPAHQRQD